MSISLAPQLANYHSWLIAFSEIKSKVDILTELRDTLHVEDEKQ